MGFSGVYRAIYDYTPQAAGELAIQDGDLLYVLDKNGDDGWWKAKKKASPDDDEEPTGLVPNNYVEEAPPLSHARALFDYTRQTDEELSFPDDATLEVFDTSDPDWILVGLDGDYGFVPANYIEVDDGAEADEAPPPMPSRPRPSAAPEPDDPPTPASPAGPAAAIAGIMAGRSAPRAASPPAQPIRQITRYDDGPASDEDNLQSPALPTRPRPPPAAPEPEYDYPAPASSPPPSSQRTPGGFHMYNINEMVSVMGKRKKMPTTLGINLGTAVILIAPERASDGPAQEWTGDRMTHYSREGKHVFMELVRPSKSVDFHAGAKDTAEEIVSALGEMAGAIRAEGLREVIEAGTGKRQRKGTISYDFMAQGEDEVTVATGDEVIIIDDSKSDEWWQVRRLKNGKEGVVPSSYVEITGTITPPPSSQGMSVGLSLAEQNRLEERRLTKEALKASKEPQQQVGPGLPLPDRGSSLMASTNGNNANQHRSRRENGRSDGGSSKTKSKPDSSKVRNWTDRSGSFSVEAQFLGLKDGKIHLHKMNGVKIAVPIAKMSQADLDFVEDATGISLDDEKPLSDVKKSRSADMKKSPPVDNGASADKPLVPEYDWFQFFLTCDVAVGLCERYAQAFAKDSMDESVLPDVDATILRNLGLREGDIIKVMRHLDQKYGREKPAGGSGGLFSGPGGTLRNNTRKGRPAPAVQTSDVVDASAFSKSDDAGAAEDGVRSPASPASPPKPQRAATSGGFDDDAWDVKPTKQPQQPPRESKPAPAPAKPLVPAMTGSMQELSLLTEPLQPTKTAAPPPTGPVLGQPTGNPAPALSQQPTGATPGFFSSMPQPQQHMSPQSMARQRPQPPQMAGQGGLVAPPPSRPLSAPQSAQPSAFAPPLAPQMTGSISSQPAPPGQSLNDINQARMQQHYAQMQQQQAQMQQPMMTGFPGQQGMMPQQTGTQFMQPMMTGAPGPSPFGDQYRANSFSPIQAQPTGFQGPFQSPQGYPQQQPGPVNSFLPPALEPQRTGMPGMPGMQQQQPTGMQSMQPQPTGFMGSHMPAAQPLVPQQTGPPPPVRFGVQNEAKLAPQPTGRRANLASATPLNPFGFS